MINRDRLGNLFKRLVEIDSISREEGKVARELEKILVELGATVIFDEAAEKVAGEVGNLVAKFKGTVEAEPLMLSGHMDTVEPGRGIKPVLKDGVFTSDGTTILGSDDKSALAIIIEVITVLQENNLPYGPLEVVFTICEEIGLMGAKHFDFSLIESKKGYILDSTAQHGIVTKTPTAYSFEIIVHGKDAHAGAAPEKGINAISVASHAISSIDIGRIDDVTTLNIGKIEGGMAINIVPNRVTIHGEARSLNEKKLDEVIEGVRTAFDTSADLFRDETIDSALPSVAFTKKLEFPGTNIADDHPVVKLAKKASEKLGHDMASITIGGGADANIFYGEGVVAGVLCPGMTDPHTVRESIKLDDMVFCSELLLEIIDMHTSGKEI